jgi:hypothetical protein
MPRRKSDGAGSRDDEATQDSTQDSPSPETTSDEHSQLPPAGAESAPAPASGTDRPFEGGPVSDSGTPETVAADTMGADTVAGEIGDPDLAAAPGRKAFEEVEDLVPPDLTAPAEPASPEAEPSLLATEVEAELTSLRTEAEADADDLTRPWVRSGSTLSEAVQSEPVQAEPVQTDPVLTEPPRTEALQTEATHTDFARSEATASAPPPPIPPVVPHVEAHDDEDEGGTSVAAWALGILLLLLAGAAIGTWAGPKIAPQLPAGMKPVADWLAPGMASTEAELAALQSKIDGVEARVGAVPSSEDLDARISAAVSPVSERIDADITTLRQSLDQTGGTEARQQLESLAAELKNQAAQLESLKTDFTGTAGQASGDVSVFKADVDGLQAELASLRDQVSAQAARLDEVASSSEARVQAAEKQVVETEEKAATALDTSEANAQQALIRAAVASGAPYGEAVTALEGRGVAVPPALAAGAEAGIPTLASLREGFPNAAHAAIQASILAGAGDGILARANAFIKAQVASRSLTPKPGPGTDAVLSRMEDKLRHDDLAGALTESQALPSEAAAAMSGWLDSAKLRLGATDGLAALVSSIPATN